MTAKLANDATRIGIPFSLKVFVDATVKKNGGARRGVNAR
jgi:hypothetical protein